MKTWNDVLDRSRWGSGEWDGEPDKAHWVYKGLDCLIVRNDMGNLCGYVGVPEGHPDFGKDTAKVWVHGGITFASKCSPSGEAEESRHVCHPQEGAANEVVWWLGFDCAHLGDKIPASKMFEFDGCIFNDSDNYKTFSFVQKEVQKLADQLIEDKP